MPSEKEMQNAFHRNNFRFYDLLGINTLITKDSLEMDICGLSCGYVSEIEIKTTLSNFKGDFKKVVKFDREHESHGKILKHDELKAGNLFCNYFSFLLPEDLVEKCDIPEYAGLYVYRTNEGGHGEVTKEKEPALLHSRTLNCELRYGVALNMAKKFWYFKNVFNKD